MNRFSFANKIYSHKNLGPVFLTIILINAVMLSALLLSPYMVGTQYGPGDYQNYLLVLLELWLVVRILIPGREKRSMNFDVQDGLHA